MSISKTQNAMLITCSVVLFLAFVFTLGVSALWVSWLLAFLFLAIAIIQEIILFGQINSETFDSSFWFAIVSIFFFTLFMLGEIGRINIQSVNIISYIIGGLFGFSLIYAFVRNFQQ
jgi:hypothetical protein